MLWRWIGRSRWWRKDSHHAGAARRNRTTEVDLPGMRSVCRRPSELVRFDRAVAPNLLESSPFSRRHVTGRRSSPSRDPDRQPGRSDSMAQVQTPYNWSRRSRANMLLPATARSNGFSCTMIASTAHSELGSPRLHPAQSNQRLLVHTCLTITGSTIVQQGRGRAAAMDRPHAQIDSGISISPTQQISSCSPYRVTADVVQSTSTREVVRSYLLESITLEHNPHRLRRDHLKVQKGWRRSPRR